MSSQLFSMSEKYVHLIPNIYFGLASAHGTYQEQGAYLHALKIITFWADDGSIKNESKID